MARSRKFLTAGAVGVAAVALIAATTSVTGAYFSETRSGAISGSVGSIHVSTQESVGGGTDHLNLSFVDLMPGEAQTVTAQFNNSGRTPEDVWVTFPNRSALHALNNLGTFGEVHMAGGSGTLVPLFDSANLNDGRRLSDTGDTCGGFSPILPACWPLLPQYKVASNVAPGNSGSVTFSFTIPAKKTGGQDGIFNVWPVTVAAGYPTTEAFGLDAVGSGNGLPFNVVATQVGHAPIS